MRGKLLDNSGYISYGPYLNEHKTSIILPRVIRRNGYEFPSDFSSISYSKRMSFVRCCSEMLEREGIGSKTFSKEGGKKYSLMSRKIGNINNMDRGYGNSLNYGYCDTTGLACGFESSKVLMKAICELLEKNEAMLFWYLGFGEKVADSIIENQYKFINKLGFKTYVFILNKLSNIPTGVTFLFNSKDKLISTGVSASFSEKEAIQNSIKEALLLEEIYKGTKYSPLFYLDGGEHEEIFNYVEELVAKMKVKEYLSDKREEKIELIDLASDICITVITKKNTTGEKIVKVLSKNLLNCLPKKSYISMNETKKIIQKFNIVQQVNLVPDCVIL